MQFKCWLETVDALEIQARIENLKAKNTQGRKVWDDGQVCPTCHGAGKVSAMHGGPPLYLFGVQQEAEKLKELIEQLPDEEEKRRLRQMLNRAY